MQRPLRLIILAGIALVLFYFVQETFFNDDNYIKPLLQERKAKDLTFRSRANSPLPDEARRSFKNLSYFEPDMEYAITAKLEKLPQQDTLELPLTDGSTEAYLRYATASFEVAGQPQQLTLYKQAAPEAGKEPQLFVPFTDKTNGYDTYGGGRYLDIPFEENATTVVLDFNRAYSPFCAFNPDYVCPVPPKDNRLDVAIPAGEKGYEEAH
ncbi:DUF1684 domain-containing protein [Pontibacter sp. E15-1]|uniref:DUF1684 domain-containing protein n=1 Tax=Pontibacter sp. E15-1 TaxID=2919918 RepID=UPI001F4F73D6|nr:DUF1684 domain-containing protein [Pontibacter sp. E15-1]MCJ8167285.1 DUF1684 domain-containing protein [Pontibacter sp. E15-1]